MASKSDIIAGVLRASRPARLNQDRNVEFKGKLPRKPKKYGPKGRKVKPGDKGKGGVSGTGKPAGDVGRGKGDLRLVNGVWKKRRFTYDQRQGFRDRRSKDDTFGGRDDGRPRP